MDELCAVYQTVDIIAKKWSLLILLAIYKKNGRSRHGAIKSAVKGITPKVLSERLQTLEKQGIIKKDIEANQVPVHTFYSLTAKGEDLIPIIKAIKDWGLKWKEARNECHTHLCNQCMV